MSVKDAKEKAEKVGELFDIFKDIARELLIDKAQFEAIEDCKWSVLGYFDAEISHAQNMGRINYNKKMHKMSNIGVIPCN